VPAALTPGRGSLRQGSLPLLNQVRM
jgi:hypothetical protein